MSTSKFITFEGDERSFEEQVVYLSQTVRVLEQALRDQQETIDNFQSRLYYIEATGLNTDNWMEELSYPMNAQSRVCTTKAQLEELIMDITCSDLNRQMQQLVSKYKKTGDDRFRIDAEYLRSEFDAWWHDDYAEFLPPTT